MYVYPRAGGGGAVSGDGISVFPMLWRGRGPSPPAEQARPYRVAVYGDSFGQRATNILGSPNSLDTGTDNPVTFRWPTEDTDRVGGVSWGPAAWLNVIGGGRYRVPYQLNRAIGGSNSGQMVHDGGTSTDRLSVLKSLIAAEVAAGRPVDAVVIHVGTNDMVTTFNVDQSYNNIRTACEEMIGAGAGCVGLHTILPRANDTYPNDRIDGTGTSTGSEDRRPFGDALNAKLVTDLPAEPTLAGKVAVADLFDAFEDPAGRSWDMLPEKVYDGLHLSAGACRELAEAMAAERLPTT